MWKRKEKNVHGITDTAVIEWYTKAHVSIVPYGLLIMIR